MTKENFGDVLTPDEIMTTWSSLKPGADYEQAESFVNGETGERMMVGKGGGAIHFCEDGGVNILWNRLAAFSSDHGTGNRKAKIISSTGRYTPPELDALFSRVAACRRYFKCDGSVCPDTPNDRISHNFKRIFDDLSWQLLRAVGNGDLEKLEAVVSHLSAYEQLDADTGKWERIAEAIELAALKLEDVPKRADVLAVYEEMDGNDIAVSSLTQNLGRMGFAWLPTCRRSKSK